MLCRFVTREVGCRERGAIWRQKIYVWEKKRACRPRVRARNRAKSQQVYNDWGRLGHRKEFDRAIGPPRVAGSLPSFLVAPPLAAKSEENQPCSHHPCHLYLLISLSPCTRPSSQPSGASEVSYPFPLLFSMTCQLLNLFSFFEGAKC